MKNYLWIFFVFILKNIICDYVEIEKVNTNLPYSLFMDLLNEYLIEDDPVGKSFLTRKSYYQLIEETFIDDLDTKFSKKELRQMVKEFVNTKKKKIHLTEINQDIENQTLIKFMQNKRKQQKEKEIIKPEL